MAFKRQPRDYTSVGIAARCGRACRAFVMLWVKLTLSVAVLCVLAGSLLYLRLLQGPLEMPVLGNLVTDQLNRGDMSHKVEIGGLVVDLEAGRGLSAIQLTEVTVSDPAGAPLFSLPKVSAKLEVADLIHGQVSPTEITVAAPDVVITREHDGQLHLEVGEGKGLALATTGAEGADNPVEAILAQLVGDVPPAPALSALTSARIEDVTLTYDDKVLDASWQSRSARLELSRFTGGARAVVSADVIDVPGQSASARLVAERYQGQKDLRLIASFGQINTDVLAAQLPGLAWLGVLRGTVEGRALGVVDPEGRVTQLGGTIIAENGQLLGWSEEGTFDMAQLDFEMDPERDLIRFKRGIVSADALDTAIRGTAGIRRDEHGNVAGLAGQLNIDRVYATLPELFSDPIVFDRGEVNFRWGFADNVFEVADSSLAAGDLVFLLDGRAAETEAGWITDLRAEAQNMTIKGLLAHWPLATAQSARDWVDENISQADVPQFLAQIRLGAGEPYLALDFEFQDLNSTYIDGMSPILGAAGRGSMSYHDLHLEFSEAKVTPKGAGPIALGGSTVAIRSFWGEVTPADIRIAARGATSAVLALIDEKPLSLVSKLGIDLGKPGGTARVTTDVTFPLIADLQLDQVDASAKARFSGFDLSTEFGASGPVRIRGDDLRLNADTSAMSLTGQVNVDGVPARVAWKERYGGAKGGRDVTVDGRTSPQLLAKLGGEDVPIEGTAPYSAKLTQKGSGPTRFDLSVDLKPVALAIEDIGWRKLKGTKGRLNAKGSIGESLSVDSFRVAAAGLLAEGNLKAGAGGNIIGARLDRLVLPGMADVVAEVGRGSDEVLEVDLLSGRVDLSGQLSEEDEGGDDGPDMPLRLAFNLQDLKLTEKLGLTAARGQFNRTADGSLDGGFTGRLGGDVPLELSLTRPSEGGGSLTMSSSDAGAALEAADLYRGAKGGRLVVNAQFGRGEAGGVSGSARIDDITVRSASTFQRVLRQGGLEQAQAQITRSGLGFRKVWVPFEYRDGVLTLSDAIATSPALALKVNGTLNEETELLDLSGVMSPAYALTGVLNEVPVLGQILSGGEGEGILAMTFTLRGPARDPELSVNPLSLLAPGFLRNVFSGSRGGGASSEQFQTRINNPPDR